MATSENTVEMIEYRLVIVQADSSKVLAFDTIGGYRLPSVRIPQWTRPARSLCKAIRSVWGLRVFVLDLFTECAECPAWAVAELLIPNGNSELKPVTLDAVEPSELGEEQWAHMAALLSEASGSSLSRVGWINEAVTWLEKETGKNLTSKENIEQYNAGGGFALLRFHTEGDETYWLKAAGDPNAHELAVTRLLSDLAGDYLPEMIASKPEWNAWLMSGAATQVNELPGDPLQLFRFLEDAVESMARIQLNTCGHSTGLLKAGAFNQSMDSLVARSAELFNSLDEAMHLQTSTKVCRIDSKRLRELRATLVEVCQRIEGLAVPMTIVHGDMNYSNILTGCRHCQFIDWSEAYVSTPFITLQHLLLLNKMESPEIKAFTDRLLRDRYKKVWLAACESATIDRGFVYMPLLAVASAIYGRGDWFQSRSRVDARRNSYLRSLARHLDRAAQAPDLQEALCR